MEGAAPATSSSERSGEEGIRYTPILLGALVTVLFAFVPLAPVGGGAVAGYLAEGGRGLRVGALSGAAASVPFVLVLVFFLSMTAVVAGTFAGPRVLLTLAGAAVGATVYTVGLSTLGGALGTRNRVTPVAAPGPDDL